MSRFRCFKLKWIKRYLYNVLAKFLAPIIYLIESTLALALLQLVHRYWYPLLNLEMMKLKYGEYNIDCYLELLAILQVVNLTYLHRILRVLNENVRRPHLRLPRKY